MSVPEIVRLVSELKTEIAVRGEYSKVLVTILKLIKERDTELYNAVMVEVAAAMERAANIREAGSQDS